MTSVWRDHHARGRGSVVEEHARRRVVEEMVGKHGEREDGSDIVPAEQRRDVGAGGGRSKEHGAASIARREGGKEVPRVGQEYRRAASAERAHEGRAALKQRESGGDELGGGTAIDGSSTGGGPERNEIHG